MSRVAQINSSSQKGERREPKRGPLSVCNKAWRQAMLVRQCVDGRAFPLGRQTWSSSRRSSALLIQSFATPAASEYLHGASAVSGGPIRWWVAGGGEVAGAVHIPVSLERFQLCNSRI